MDPSAIIAKAPASGAQAAAGSAVAAGASVAGTPGDGAAAKAGAKPNGDAFAAFLLALQNLGIDPATLVGKPSTPDATTVDGTATPDGSATLDGTTGDAVKDDSETAATSTATDQVAAALAAALAAAAPKAVVPTASPAGATGDATAGGRSDGAAVTVADATAIPAAASKPLQGGATADAKTIAVDGEAAHDDAPGATAAPIPPPATNYADAAKQTAAPVDTATAAQAGASKTVADPLPSERAASVEPASNGRPARSEGATAKSADPATDQQVAAPATRERPTQHGAGQGGDLGSGQHGTSGRHVETAPEALVADHVDASRSAESAVTAHAAPVVREAVHTAAPSVPTPLRDVEEVVRLASLRGGGAPRDGGEMRLHVASDSLGNVEVHVSVQQDSVHATLLADHDHARQALQASRSSLEAALQRSSLKLEGFTVDVGSQHQQQQQSQGRQQPSPAQVFSKWFGPSSPDGAIAPVAVAATQTAPAHRGALSLHA